MGTRYSVVGGGIRLPVVRSSPPPSRAIRHGCDFIVEYPALGRSLALLTVDDPFLGDCTSFLCRCKPKKCRQECKKSCPVVKIGKLCVEVSPTSKLAWISEELCIGCVTLYRVVLVLV